MIQYTGEMQKPHEVNFLLHEVFVIAFRLNKNPSFTEPHGRRNTV